MPEKTDLMSRVYSLTYNPHDSRIDEIVSLIAWAGQMGFSVREDVVGGFGSPQLRVSPGYFVEGILEIKRFFEQVQADAKDRE